MNSTSGRPLALYVGVLLATVLVAFYFKIILPFVTFPADLLMWGETDFTGNIIRLRGGHPMYSPAADINSSTYPPLAAIVTYWVATILRLPVEVPFLRAIQLGYVVVASLLGLVCWRLLRFHLHGDAPLPHAHAWSALVAGTVFLAATSPATSQWVHALHTDALSLLWSVASFAVLLRYMKAPGRASFALLCVMPAVGFAIKQYLLVWAPIAFFTLLIDDPRNRRRLVALVAITTGLTFAGVGLFYALWGRDYVFWVFEVVGGARSRIGFSAGGFEMSVPRAVDHLLRAWAPLAPGLLAGWMLFRSAPSRRLTALWVPWILLVGSEAMTSGTGWDALYHFGPAVTIGTVWLLAALPAGWPEGGGAPHPIVRSSWAFAGLLVLFLALGAVPSGNQVQQRYWRRGLPDGSTELVRAMESEVDGMDLARVLVDWGNWMYLPANHLARDRAVSMADFPTVGRYDLLQPLLERIQGQEYDKILVHRLDHPAFIYDWRDLETPTGIRAALREHYVEVRVISAFEVPGAPQIQFNGPVSVLEPRPR